MAYLVAGPLVALIGIGAIFFVLRRKSEDKRSMYSSRRAQIEHKVRAARQRTLAPHGHADRAPEPAPEPAPAMAQQAPQPTMVYEAPAFSAPPVAPPPAAPPVQPSETPPWEQPSIPAPTTAPGSFDYPAAQPEPFSPAPVEPFRPAPEPTPMPRPSEPVWTPAPEPLPPAQTVAPAASTVAAATASGSAAGWSVVSTEKDSADSVEPSGKKRKGKGDDGAATGSWQLASGEAPGDEADEPMIRRPSGTVMAIAQYAVLVVGLVMVLIGVLVMVANSHVT
ncbi:MAG TPA: hypothetical protein VJS19_13615 [Candidatus Dormibacteraeota bacterium]|nr:hypothetical protein [Candidatus Dormibacteraeota bacterium]